jgi:nicotinate dehydrogenase subunit A
MSTIRLIVNGRSETVYDVDPTTPLLYVLSDDLGLRGPKLGCGLGQCGACTVIVRNRAVRSCVTPVGAVNLYEVTTLEGLGTIEQPHPIQQAFIDEQAAQCGYCLSGVMITAKAFIDGHPEATDADVQRAMSNVLCRCFGHARMYRAIKRYATTKRHAANHQAHDEHKDSQKAHKDQKAHEDYEAHDKEDYQAHDDLNDHSDGAIHDIGSAGGSDSSGIEVRR